MRKTCWYWGCAGLLAGGAAAPLQAEGPAGAPVALPTLTVFSPAVANQAPASSFALPVSALRFEPAVDLQARNLAEAEADVTIRGGTFENSGVRVGAVPLLDPQTGHYAAELPIAPGLLGAPQVLTGLDNAAGSFNAAVGTVAYGWRPARAGGLAGLAAGSDGLDRETVSAAATGKVGAGVAGLDLDWAHVRSRGPIPFGDSHFSRVNGRVQFRAGGGQTDLFAGYQKKFFGWPNLYTPFNSNETENLEQALFVLNHRQEWAGGSFVEAGVFSRRNKDDYAFDRFAPTGAVHPFQHTTREAGAGVHGLQGFGAWSLGYAVAATADDLQSTSLLFGRYHTRTLVKSALVPETGWSAGPGARWVAQGGVTWDDSNRTGGAVAPLAGFGWVSPGGFWREVRADFAETTQLPGYTALNSSPTAGLFRGNPNLGREITRNWEIKARQAWAGWTTAEAVFHRRDDALVDWTYRRGVTARTANAVDLATTGAEVTARRSWSRLDLVVGYTWLTKQADYRGAPVNASFYALNFARHRLTAAVTWHVTSELEVRVDNSARVQQDNPLRAIGGDEALLTELGVYYRPRAFRGWELSALVDNLWDSNFQEVPAVPAAPRRESIGVAYGW